MRASNPLRRSLLPLSLALALTPMLGGCKKNPAEKVLTNHPTINLFGFEESALHHIHNTVELHRNIFLVRYEPESPDRVEWINCPISANYSYQKSAGRRVESMYIRSFADLQARVPVNYARFEAYVKGGKALEFNYVTIGSYELLNDFTIPKDDPDCARATHYVVTLSVGAFTFAEEASVEGGVKVDLANTGVGVGASGGRGSGEMTQVGSLDACMDDGTAAMDCFTPLQLMMMPLANRHWNADAVATTASGSGSGSGSDSGSASASAEQGHQAGSEDLSLHVDAEVWRPGSFMAAALERLLIVAARVAMTTDFGFDDKGSTVVAGFLTEGRPQFFSRPLDAGQSYVIFAAGATEANVDITISDSSGNVVARDDAPDGTPAVTFAPSVTDNYRIELSVVGQSEEFGALVVMQDGGLRVEAPILQSVFQRLLDAGTFASNKIQDMGAPTGLAFHENNWAVQGTILYPGEAIRQSGVNLEAKATVVAAVSHEESFNIDLEVIDANSGQTWADTEPDGNPLVLIEEPNASTSYDVRVLYGSGESPTLATLLILKLSD